MRWEAKQQRKRVERALEKRRSASDAYRWNQKMDVTMERLQGTLMGVLRSVGTKDAPLASVGPILGTATMTDSTDCGLYSVNRAFQMWRR